MPSGDCSRICSTCGERRPLSDFRKRSDVPGGFALTCRGCSGRRGSLSARFWAKVNKGPGCWLWTGADKPQGYGCVHVDGSTRTAHRIAYELAVGPIPEGAVVMHLCDVPKCVNPAHLRVATQGENVRDMVEKGRQRHASTYRRVGEAERKAIMSAEGTISDIARRFGRGRSTVRRIRA